MASAQPSANHLLCNPENATETDADKTVRIGGGRSLFGTGERPILQSIRMSRKLPGEWGGTIEVTMSTYRPDRTGAHRVEFDKNKRRILATCDTCGICGQPVDKSLKFPHPLSPTIDHIIPVDKGGHPSDMANLQLAHFACNRAKSNRLTAPKAEQVPEQIGNRNLPQSRDWATYRGA